MKILGSTFQRILPILFLTLLCFWAEAQKSMELISKAEFREIGPYRGGRSCAVTGVEGNDKLFYFGSTGGGVWKTEDGGRSWDNISDGYFGGSIGSIAVASSDANVIYVGGGEKTVRGNVSYGYGIWKSENAGKTWVFAGLPKSRHISRIRIHPTNPNIVWAAVMGDLYKDTDERGVYKSVDGGKNWKKVLFANSSAGAVDLVIDPNNARNLYASTWNIRRTPYSLSSGGDGSAMWKSTDYGETWTNISANEGLPSGAWGITGVAVAHGNSEKVYALIENDKGGLYVSKDGGDSWKLVNSKRDLRQRAWYYTRIYADTQDENTVYVVNVSYHKSTDGGKNFKSARAPHGDHHDLWIDPDNNQRLIIGDDGGAQVSYDGGDLWSTYHNQPTAQFYRVTTDDHFPYRIYAAQQDNSTVRISSRSQGGSIDEDDWESTAGGESAHIAIDPKDNEIVYGGSYGGFLTRKNHRTGSRRAINVWPDNPMGYGAEGMKYRFQWNFPIVFSQHNKDRLYAFSNQVHYTEDEGQTWTTASEDLTRNAADKLVSSGGPITKDNTGVEYYCTIFAVAEAPTEKGVMYVGTDDGRVHITRDEAKTWTEITPKGLPKWIQINSIESSNSDKGVAYLAATNYKNGDFAPYLYMTNNYGQSWKKIVNGINVEHFTRVIREDKNDPNFLYAGTETGLYYSADRGLTWLSVVDFPIVPVTDLHIKGDALVIATQGRGLWVYDYLDILRASSQLRSTGDHFFNISDAYRYKGWKSDNPSGAGTNKYPGMELFYYLEDWDENKDSLTLTIVNTANDTVEYSSFHEDEKFKIDPEKGSNVFQWNLSYPGARKFDGMILWWGNLGGPKSIPGEHKVIIRHNGKQIDKSFNLMQSPISEGSPADIKSQYAFVQSINDKVDEAHETIIEIRSSRSRIKSLLSKVEDEEIKEVIARIDSISSEVEKNLYQTKNRSGQDPLNFPIRLTNKLAHLNSLTQMGSEDFPPTSQAIEVRDELVALIDVELKKYEEVEKVLLPRLNELIIEKKVYLIE